VAEASVRPGVRRQHRADQWERVHHSRRHAARVRGSVRDRLAAFVEGELDASASAVVREHLEACGKCRERLQRVEQGVALARGLAAAAPSPRRWAAVRPAIVARAGASDRRRAAMPFAWAAAAAVLLLGAGLVFVRSRGDDPVFTSAPRPETAWEKLALATHAGLSNRPEALERRTSSPTELRDWLEERSDLSISLATSRHEADPSSIVPVGGKVLSPWGHPVAAVSYRVDGEPVTLLVTKGETIPTAPEWTASDKRVSVRRGPGDVKMLTWRNSGNAYALVSKLPRLGERSCFVCHGSADRRKAIERAAAKGARGLT